MKDALFSFRFEHYLEQKKFEGKLKDNSKEISLGQDIVLLKILELFGKQFMKELLVQIE